MIAIHWQQRSLSDLGLLSRLLFCNGTIYSGGTALDTTLGLSAEQVVSSGGLAGGTIISGFARQATPRARNTLTPEPTRPLISRPASHRAFDFTLH